LVTRRLPKKTGRVARERAEFSGRNADIGRIAGLAAHCKDQREIALGKSGWDDDIGLPKTDEAGG
jgi:hypothetical protein